MTTKTPSQNQDYLSRTGQGPRSPQPVLSSPLPIGEDRSGTDPTKEATIQSLLDPLIGIELPGDCPDCDAYTKVSREADGIYLLQVSHDDGCVRLEGMAMASPLPLSRAGSADTALDVAEPLSAGLLVAHTLHTQQRFPLSEGGDL